MAGLSEQDIFEALHDMAVLRELAQLDEFDIRLSDEAYHSQI